ncbi:uncharacterized protein LOC122502304 isoform X3 [Leptopilina heterotoma]|uniref:uncharacterized protein LOC122502304 isoform X3 n=1 Tax=Leptopilina heterotoma TaxID=63436 RepID=UPI001CA96412|nr:uncharacterized protein LOC122502304 isoform X3 [Leptopilina heterotoma]
MSNPSNEKKFLVLDFDDGPQVVPRVWISGSGKSIFWPNLTNMNAYYKAVECEIKPTSKWAEIEFKSEISSANRLFRKSVMRSLTEIKFLLATVSERLEDIEKDKNEIKNLIQEKFVNGTGTLNSDKMMKLKKTFPLKDLSELAKLETDLVAEEFYQDVLSYLNKIGGKNVKDAVYSMLRKVFCNEVAAQFSWLGCKGKYRFSSLEVTKVILG